MSQKETIPSRDVDIRNFAIKHLNISKKSAWHCLYKEELIMLLKGRGYK